MLKKIISLLSVIAISVSLVACNGETVVTESDESSYPSAIPSYEMFKDERYLEHVAFWSPPPTDIHYKWLAESGMTRVVVDSKYDVLPNSSNMEQVLSLCEKYGLTAYPVIVRNGTISENYFNRFFKYKSFGGFYTDEPLTRSHLNAIFENCEKAFGNVDYAYDTLVTLICDAPVEYDASIESLEDYYDLFGEKMKGKTKVISADFYPMRGNGYNAVIASEWLYTLNNAAVKALQYGFDLWYFLSTMSTKSQSLRHPDYADLSYNIWTLLAYGVKGIEYFCYTSPGGPPYDGEFSPNDYAMLNIDDNYYVDGIIPEAHYDKYYKTETYNNVQKLIEEFGEFDHVLTSFDWQGTLVNAGSEAATTAGECFNFERQRGNSVQKFVPLASHKRVKTVKSSEDLIIGTFRDDNGYEGFMAVNFADPFFDLDNEVEIVFNGAKKALVYSKEGREVVTLSGGKFTREIPSGEGCFIIPLS